MSYQVTYSKPKGGGATANVGSLGEVKALLSRYRSSGAVAHAVYADGSRVRCGESGIDPQTGQAFVWCWS